MTIKTFLLNVEVNHKMRCKISHNKISARKMRHIIFSFSCYSKFHVTMFVVCTNLAIILSAAERMHEKKTHYARISVGFDV